MPQLRLTKRNIEQIARPASGQILYYDSDLRGFGLRVGARSQTFFAERQVRRRTVRVTIGPYPVISPEVARRKAMELLAEMVAGINPNEVKRAGDVNAMSVREAFDAFFQARTHLSATTVTNYKRSIGLYLKGWAAKPIGSLTTEMVISHHRHLTDKHGGVTANNVMRHLRSIYNFVAATVGDLPPNPVSVLGKARLWAAEKRRRTVIPSHALARWFSAVRDETDDARDFLTIALFTGMRRSEIASLRWEYIDLAVETLLVPRTKNGEPLQLPLSWYLTDLLINRRQADPGGEWVFPGRGKTGHLTEVKTFVARVAKASGLSFTTHDLRRTFITLAEGLDIPAYALKRLLNHSIENDVTGGYIVIDAERLRGPVDRIAERILEIVHEQGAEGPPASGESAPIYLRLKAGLGPSYLGQVSI